MLAQGEERLGEVEEVQVVLLPMADQLDRSGCVHGDDAFRIRRKVGVALLQDFRLSILIQTGQRLIHLLERGKGERFGLRAVPTGRQDVPDLIEFHVNPPKMIFLTCM